MEKLVLRSGFAKEKFSERGTSIQISLEEKLKQATGGQVVISAAMKGQTEEMIEEVWIEEMTGEAVARREVAEDNSLFSGLTNLLMKSSGKTLAKHISTLSN